MSADPIQELVQIGADAIRQGLVLAYALLLGDHETTFPSAELDQLKHT